MIIDTWYRWMMNVVLKLLICVLLKLYLNWYKNKLCWYKWVYKMIFHVYNGRSAQDLSSCFCLFKTFFLWLVCHWRYVSKYLINQIKISRIFSFHWHQLVSKYWMRLLRIFASVWWDWISEVSMAYKEPTVWA